MINNIHNEVKLLLEAFGYVPHVKEFTNDYGTDKVDIFFSVDNGSESMPMRYKEAIKSLSEGYFDYFYYESGGIQHVYMYKQI